MELIDCAWLYDGIWDRQADKLRPWRRIHGWFICRVLRHHRYGLILHPGFIDFDGHLCHLWRFN